MKSKLTPELLFLAQIYGHNVFSDGRTFSIDEKLSEDALEKIIDYMLNEGLIDSEHWVFLT